MTHLTIYAIKPDQPVKKIEETTDTAKIAATMAQINVGFERWQAQVALAPGAEQDQILAAYAPQIDALRQRGGYQSVDVVRIHPDHPDRVAMRDKFLHEHIHDDDEVRFFVEGAGAFYLREVDRVYRVHCEQGDLLVVPKGKRHWFDMGASPLFCAIRLFTTPDGWQAAFTADKIASLVPGFQE